MSQEPVHITEAEGELMAALWRLGPLTQANLMDAVKARRDWAEPTVKTLLARLMQKQAIRSVRADGRLLYHPLVSRDQHRTAEIIDLTRRLFDGDPAALRAFLDRR